MSLAAQEELRNAIDLIVVTAVRESQELPEEVVEPRGVPGQGDMAGLNTRTLGLHAGRLVALRRNPDRVRKADRTVC